MKKSSTLIGLTVVSLATAEKVGNVSSYLVNAEKGRVDYLVIETDHEMMNSFVISTKDVLRAGNNAVMVENEDVMLDNRSVADAIKLFQKNIQIKDTNILTDKGNYLGRTGGFYIHEERFDITGLELIPSDGGASKIIPSKYVIIYGKNTIIVKDEAVHNLLNSEDEFEDEYQEVEQVSFFMGPMKKTA